MRKGFLILIILIGKMYGQITFCPPGAQWNYLFDVYFVTKHIRADNEKITYVRDSIVGNDTCKVLKHRHFFVETDADSSDKLTIIKQRGDTVFFRNYITQNSWQILYNFAAAAGQSWTNFHVRPNFLVVTNTITVNAVNYININGFLLKQLTVSLYFDLFGPLQYNFKITERFGTNDFLFYNFDYIGNWKNTFNSFLCYKDNQFGSKQLTIYGCDYSNPVGINSIAENNSFAIFPNPTNEYLNIRFKQHYETCVAIVTNNLGEIFNVPSEEITELNTRLDVKNLKPGIYFLQIFEKGSLVKTEKIIKE